MRSILTALQDGRLFELPEAGKARALEFLARILDANPNIEVGTDTIEEIQLREQECNTGIGMGVGVPHVRARREEGELFSAIGWSSKGIDYDAADGKPVHLVVMYYIPGAQKNVYLKEISSLVKAIRKSGGMDPIAHAADLNADDQTGGQAGPNGDGSRIDGSRRGGGDARPTDLAGGVILGVGRASQHRPRLGAGCGLGGRAGERTWTDARPRQRRGISVCGPSAVCDQSDAVYGRAPSL